VKRNLIVISCFIIFIAIILFPPIVYHYIYPNINDDTATLFGSLISHNYPYTGFIYIGIPILWLANLIHVNSYNVWMWFNLLALIPCGVALYFIGTKLFNWKIGLMMLFVPIFVSGGILEYQYMGIIFSMIEVVILIPLLIYCVIKYLTDKRVYQLIIVIILSLIASTFHTSGLYVPLIAGTAIAGYFIYKLIKHNLSDIKHYLNIIFILIGIAIIGLVGILILDGKSVEFVDKLSNALINNQTISTRNLTMPIMLWISFVTIPMILIIGISLFLILKNKIKLNRQSKLYLYALGCWLFVLGILGFGRISTDPIRAELDATVVIALIGAFLLGIVLTNVKDKSVLMIFAFIVLIGMAIQFNLWFRDNTAITTSDKQAISYLNTLNYSDYNCDSNVPYWIYDRLIKEQYSSNATDLIIVRNKPMTAESDSTNADFIPHNYTLTPQDILVKSFSNNGIEVDIYEK